MTTFLLIRHGLTDAVGQRITGRLPGLFLNAVGREQAAGLPERMRRWKIDAIYSSPLERTMETAGVVAGKLGMKVIPNPAFLEFDFGQWSGVSIAELDQRADWKAFCQFRSSTRAPGGELISEVQTRVVTGLTSLCQAHPGETVAVFSHADAIKAALLHYLPAPTDNLNRLVVDPASISVVTLHAWGPVISGINLT